MDFIFWINISTVSISHALISALGAGAWYPSQILVSIRLISSKDFIQCSLIYLSIVFKSPFRKSPQYDLQSVPYFFICLPHWSRRTQPSSSRTYGVTCCISITLPLLVLTTHLGSSHMTFFEIINPRSSSQYTRLSLLLKYKESAKNLGHHNKEWCAKSLLCYSSSTDNCMNFLHCSSFMQSKHVQE